MTLLEDLGLKKLNPFEIFCNNEGRIKPAYNPVFHSRTKHITMHYHFIREKVESGKIQICWLSHLKSSYLRNLEMLFQITSAKDQMG